MLDEKRSNLNRWDLKTLSVPNLYVYIAFYTLGIWYIHLPVTVDDIGTDPNYKLEEYMCATFHNGPRLAPIG